MSSSLSTRPLNRSVIAWPSAGEATTWGVIEVLLLGRRYGYERLRAVVRQAVELGCSDVAAIRYLLEQEPRHVRAYSDPIDLGRLARYERLQPSMAKYDRLLAAVTTEVIQ